MFLSAQLFDWIIFDTKATYQTKLTGKEEEIKNKGKKKKKDKEMIKRLKMLKGN